MIRGKEPQIAIVTTAIAYIVQPGMLSKGETIAFMSAIWLCAVLLIFGIEDQIEHFKKRQRRRKLKAMKRQRKPELANIRMIK